MTTFKINANKMNLRSNPGKDFEDKSNGMGILLPDSTFESSGEIANELGTCDEKSWELVLEEVF